MQCHHRGECATRGQRAVLNLVCRAKLLNRHDKAVNFADCQKKIDGNWQNKFQGDHSPFPRAEEDCSAWSVKEQT